MAESVTEKKQKRTIQCTWGEKSKLERNLILILIFVILLFIALLLYVIIKPAVTKRRCISKNCLIAASEIISRINPEINPCDDAAKFACSMFRKHSGNNAKRVIEQELLDILQEEVDENDHFMLKHEKLLFQSCLKDDDDLVTVIVDQIVDFDWPVVVGYQWRDQNFDWQQLIFKLRKAGYPFEMILQVKVVHEGPAYTIKISPPDIKSIRAGTEYYKQYMAEVAVVLGSEAKRAENEMEKVFYFAQQLKKVSDLHPGSVSTTVRNYLEDNDDIDWISYINNILYPVNQVSLDDYVQFPSKEFTNELYNLIYRTPKRVIANYIIWSAIETIMPVMPKELREMRQLYDCQTKSTQVSREQLCQQTLRNFLPDPSHIVYAREHLPMSCGSKMKGVFNNIREELIDLFNKTSWIDEESRNRSVAILRDMVAVVGMTGDYFNDSNFAKDSWPGSDSKILQNASFLQMALAENYRYQNNQFYKVGQNRKQEEYVPATAIFPILNLESNVIILPLGIIQEGIFGEDKPMYLNYGSLGKAIAMEISKVIIETESKSGENTIWNNSSRREFYNKSKCLSHGDNYITLPQLWDITGMQVAYSAYTKWLNKNAAESQLPGLVYTPEQLFWISSINCSELETSAILGDMTQFDKDFNCPTNAQKECEIF